jgi:hypothetical protein
MKFGKTLLLIYILTVYSVGLLLAQPDRKNSAVTDSKISATKVVAVELYPNPAKDFLNIQINEPDVYNVKFELYNIIGNPVTVKSEKINQGEFKIETSDLTPGYYLLVIQDEKVHFKHTYKFMKR